MPEERRPGLFIDPARNIAILADAFEIDEQDVIADAEHLLASTAPRDEFLAALCAAHGWGAELGVVYLAYLTMHVDSSAGPIPAAWSTT